jgi:hypothetical protein
VTVIAAYKYVRKGKQKCIVGFVHTRTFKASTISTKLDCILKVLGAYVKSLRAFFNTTPSPGIPLDHIFSICCCCSQLTMTSLLISKILLAGAFRKSPCGNIDAAGEPKLLGKGVELDVMGGVVSSSIGAALEFFPFLSDFEAFFAGLMNPLRAFIL